jgi:PurA ssDNA and RNA-binding protein
MAPKPPVNEDTLKSGQIQIERKSFQFTLKENVRGRLLRITEDIGGRRNSIIIPSTGLREFKQLLEEMLKAAEELPPGQSDSIGNGPIS